MLTDWIERTLLQINGLTLLPSAGWILAVDQSGRISSDLLQHHRSQAHALLFYAFDVLSHRGDTLRICRSSGREGADCSAATSCPQRPSSMTSSAPLAFFRT